MKLPPVRASKKRDWVEAGFTFGDYDGGVLELLKLRMI